MELNKLGFCAFFQKHLDNFKDGQLEGVLVGRICSEHKCGYKLYSEKGESNAIISGKFRNNCKTKEDFPAVGDWVIFEKLDNRARIKSVLPRKSKFSRKVAGKETQEQIIASNIDIAFIVCALNYDFNLRRIERYLSLIWQSGAIPVVVLTKTDLCEDVQTKINEVANIAFGIDIHAISNFSSESIEILHDYFKENKTVVLLGSSGVGKSSLINNLAQENLMKVHELRSTIDKGRHTTTHKQMFILPKGGLIIDTPGIRELQLWDAEGGISQCFSDIEELAESCRFGDCKHQDEPECAVHQAIKDGLLDSHRLKNYLKVQKEQEYISDRQTQSAAKIERDKWKAIHRQIKYFK